MRIAFIVDAFPVLSETFILNQITGLTDAGHDISIFAGCDTHDTIYHAEIDEYGLDSSTYYYKKRPRNRIIKVFNAAWLFAANIIRNPLVTLRAVNFFKYGRLALSLDLLYYAVCFLKHGDFDIIQCHYAPNGELGAILKDLGLKGKVVTMLHGYDLRKVSEKGAGIYKRLFEDGDLFLSISDFTSEKLIRFGVDPKKIVEHPVGIDMRKFPHRGKYQECKRPFRILTVARLVKEKGIDAGIRAFAGIPGGTDGIEYEIVGTGNLGTSLKELADSLGVSEKIKFSGGRNSSYVIERLYSSDVFFLPSRAEVLPVSVMEAQAAGVPVLATDVGGVSEIVRDGITGLLVKNGDINGMAGKLKSLIGDSDLRRVMAETARENIENKYDINKLNLRLIDIYKEVLK